MASLSLTAAARHGVAVHRIAVHGVAVLAKRRLVVLGQRFKVRLHDVAALLGDGGQHEGHGDEQGRRGQVEGSVAGLGECLGGGG